MQFQFRLVPVEQIAPWGIADGHPYLSWFGLTDGWFWIEVGGHELFRYSQTVLDYWSRLYPEAPPNLQPYTNYQIARYWEDLLEMLPAILDPIPEDFALRVSDAQAWRDWQEMTQTWLEGRDETSRDTYATAFSWWWHRSWNASHLASPPHIWLWRIGDDVHIRWDNRDVMVCDVPVWTAQQGQCILPVSDFLAAIESFHSCFLYKMGHRVNDAVAAWPHPEVAIDSDALLRGQADRSEWLKPAIEPWAAKVRRAFSWEQVRAALIILEQQVKEHQDGPFEKE